MGARRIALTFEAGGDVGPARAMLGALAEAGAVGTFFLDGRWAEQHPDVVREIAASGHELGNHGYRHPDWTALSAEEIEQDLAATERVAGELTRRAAKPWARPPFGALDERVLAVLERAGYRAFYRDAVDGAHWPGETTAASIHQRALASALAGEPVVMHSSSADSARVLPSILAELRGRGYALVTLSGLGAIPSPRPRRHPDFGGLQVRPGYVRPRAPGRWQSLNVLELGTALTRRAGACEAIAELGGGVCELLTGDDGAVAWEPEEHDRRVLVLAGGVRCEFTGPEGALGELVAREGDFFLCPAGAATRLEPVDGRRFVALVWRVA